MSQHHDAPGRPLWKDPNLLICFGITLMVVLGVTSIAPALPLIIRELPGVTDKNIGMILTVFTIPGVVLTPIMGVLADRYGRKRILVPSLVLFGVSGFLCAFMRSWEPLLALRFLQGVGSASLGALNLTVIGDLYSGRQRATALGLNAAVLSMGVAGYPLIGGLLASLGWYYPFYLPIVALPLAVVVHTRLRNPEPSGPTDLREYFAAALRALNNRQIIGLFLATSVTFILIYGPFLTYMPILLDTGYNASPFAIGVIMSVNALITGLASSQLGRLTRVVPERLLVKIAFLFYAAAAVLMFHMPGLWWFLLPVFLFGLAQGMNLPSIQSLLTGLAPMELRAGFMSLNGMVLRLGQTIGPLLMGLVYGLAGMGAVFYFSSALALVMFVVASVILAGPLKPRT
jgi:MFS family permease